MVTSQAIQNVLVSTCVHKHMMHTVISIVSSCAYVVCVYMGGCEVDMGGRGPTSTNAVDHQFECSAAS